MRVSSLSSGLLVWAVLALPFGAVKARILRGRRPTKRPTPSPTKRPTPGQTKWQTLREARIQTEKEARIQAEKNQKIKILADVVIAKQIRAVEKFMSKLWEIDRRLDVAEEPQE
eukprot:scaffold26_cov29-Attheya_sp.AAC.1